MKTFEKKLKAINQAEEKEEITFYHKFILLIFIAVEELIKKAKISSFEELLNYLKEEKNALSDKVGKIPHS